MHVWRLGLSEQGTEAGNSRLQSCWRSPTPFDAGRFALFGQPVFKEDVFDDGAGAVVELAGNDLDEAHQGIAAFDRDRPDQLTRRGGKQLVAERGFGLAALDQGEKTRFGG
jgi:hypothetical protein